MRVMPKLPMRTWGTILRILSQESPIIIVKEIVWRFEQQRRIRKFSALLENFKCPVRVRYIPYYQPDLTRCSEQVRFAILNSAEEVCQGRYPLLSYATQTLGFPPAWNVDFVSSKEWDLSPSGQVKIIRGDGSDVKAVWELSRLQFLAILGKAYRLTGEQRYREAGKQIVSNWIDLNPVGRGVNWTVAMEAGLRAISVLFFVNLIWPLGPDEALWLDKVTVSLWQHVFYIENHLEFSHIARSNHYLSNIIALHFVTAFLEGAESESRRKMYRKQVEKEILHEVYEDGGDYEASLGYHALVAQLFTTAMLTMSAEGVTPDPEFSTRLRRMYEIMAEVGGVTGKLPHVGDVDDGRVELLVGDLEQIAEPVERRHSLLIPGLLGVGGALFKQQWGNDDDAFWYGLPCLPGSVPQARNNVIVFVQSGIALARRDRAEVLFFAIPNGIQGKGSHTHNDKLSVILRIDGAELFCDSGTGCYTRDVAMRNEFRSTRAHNTVIVNALEQNTIPKRGAFSIGNEARLTPIEWENKGGRLRMSASHSGYQRIGVTHKRTIVWDEAYVISIEDEFSGSGQCSIQANYTVAPEWEVTSIEPNTERVHFGRGTQAASIEFHCEQKLTTHTERASITRTFGVPIAATRITVSTVSALPLRLRSTVKWN